MIPDYKIDSTWNATVANFGNWNRATRLNDMRATRILSRERKNLSGREMKVAIVIIHNDTIDHLHDFR